MFTHTINLNRGDSQVVRKGGVSAYAWMDRKVVMVMFTNAQPSVTASVLRRQKDHTHDPSAVLRQFCCTTSTWEGSTEETSCVGTMPVEPRVGSSIGTHLLSLRRCDHILQKSFCPENVHKNVKEFRLQLARELMGDYSSRC